MSDADGGVAVGVMLSSNDDLPPRDRWARLRFAIIGPLLAAPPADGELQWAAVPGRGFVGSHRQRHEPHDEHELSLTSRTLQI